MRKIKKGIEPKSLTRWKRRYPDRTYIQLSDAIRRDIRQHLLNDQYYLCAYCCDRISSIDECHNEHLEARKHTPQRSLDFSNLVASCNTINQCGQAHAAQSLPLTPLQDACESELVYQLSGRVQGITPQAKQTIQVLNLNHKALVEKRKQLTHCLLWDNALDPMAIQVSSPESLIQLVDDLALPQQGKLDAFSPVVINVLRLLL